MLSVMIIERLGFDRWSRETVLGWRCSPSAMMVYHGGVTLPVSGNETKPASPGALEDQLGIAFKVWVKALAPAPSPLSPSSYVAVEWPMATLIPCKVNDLISAVESGSSGARVTSLMVDCKFADPKIAEGEAEHGWNRELL